MKAILKRKLPQFSWVLIALVMCTSLWMCKQDIDLIDKIRDTGDTGDGPQTIISINCDEEDTDCNEILCFLEDPSDYVNKVNMILFHYGQAIREAAEDEDLLCLMVEEMIEDVGGYGVSINNLALSESAFKDTLNYHLRQSIENNNIYPLDTEPNIMDSLALTNWDASKYLRSKFKYDTDPYEPIIYFIKAPEECDEEVSVGVFVGVEVTCCDQVPGWKEGNEILLSEEDHEDASTNGDLSIFVGTGEIGLVSAAYQVIPDEHKADVTRMVDVNIDVDRHQIKAGYRYEKNCKSEISGATMKFLPNTTDFTSLAYWGGFVSHKINKSDINNSVIFTSDKDGYDMPESNFNSNQMSFVVIWEQDWPASWKRLYNPCSPFPSHDVDVRMTFSNEWYYTGCDETNVWFPSVNSNEIFENSKCMFDLKRVQ